jgi:hypothetical protein
MPTEQRQPGSWLDLAQSCLRLSWALSLLGANEAMHLVTGRARAGRTGAGLEAVRQAACEQMNDATREMFRAGDQIQRGVVETFADLARQPLFDPRRLARTALDAGSRFARWAEAAPATAPRAAGSAGAAGAAEREEREGEEREEKDG